MPKITKDSFNATGVKGAPKERRNMVRKEVLYRLLAYLTRGGAGNWLRGGVGSHF